MSINIVIFIIIIILLITVVLYIIFSYKGGDYYNGGTKIRKKIVGGSHIINPNIVEALKGANFVLQAPNLPENIQNGKYVWRYIEGQPHIPPRNTWQPYIPPEMLGSFGQVGKPGIPAYVPTYTIISLVWVPQNEQPNMVARIMNDGGRYVWRYVCRVDGNSYSMDTMALVYDPPNWAYDVATGLEFPPTCGPQDGLSANIAGAIILNGVTLTPPRMPPGNWRRYTVQLLKPVNIGIPSNSYRAMAYCHMDDGEYIKNRNIPLPEFVAERVIAVDNDVQIVDSPDDLEIVRLLIMAPGSRTPEQINILKAINKDNLEHYRDVAFRYHTAEHPDGFPIIRDVLRKNRDGTIPRDRHGNVFIDRVSELNRDGTPVLVKGVQGTNRVILMSSLLALGARSNEEIAAIPAQYRDVRVWDPLLINIEQPKSANIAPQNIGRLSSQSSNALAGLFGRPRAPPPPPVGDGSSSVVPPPDPAAVPPPILRPIVIPGPPPPPIVRNRYVILPREECEPCEDCQNNHVEHKSIYESAIDFFGSHIDKITVFIGNKNRKLNPNNKIIFYPKEKKHQDRPNTKITMHINNLWPGEYLINNTNFIIE